MMDLVLISFVIIYEYVKSHLNKKIFSQPYIWFDNFSNSVYFICIQQIEDLITIYYLYFTECLMRRLIN